MNYHWWYNRPLATCTPESVGHTQVAQVNGTLQFMVHSSVFMTDCNIDFGDILRAQQTLSSGSTLAQTVLAACWKFAMVRTYGIGPTEKQNLTL